MADTNADAPVRTDPRYPASAVPGITGMRLSPGDTVKLVNISASGVLVEGKTRFVPGTRVSVIFEGPAAPATVKARVIRCQVSAIGGGGSLQYHSAIAFEAKIDLQVDEATLPQQPSPPPPPAPAKKSSKAAAAATPAPLVNRW